MSETIHEATEPINAADVAKAQEQAGVDEQAKQEAANVTLKELGKAFRKGESSWKAGMLETGRLSLEYLRQRMALKATRAVAVKAIEGQLAVYATQSVNVNSMIRCYESLRLLMEATEQGEKLAKGMPYGTIRDAISQLVQRINPDSPEESYVLLTGMETECVEAFRKVASDKLDVAAAKDVISIIVRQHTAQEHSRTAAKAEAEREAARKAAEAAEQARKERAEADAKAKAAEVEAAKAKAANDQETSQKLSEAAEAAEAARMELLAKQQAEIAAHEDAALKARKAADAEKDRKNADKAKANQDAKDKRSADRVLGNQAARPSAPECRQGENLLHAARAGTAKDIAGMACELITACQEPDSTLESLLHMLDEHKELSKASHRAVKAALVSLTHSASKPPVPTSAVA